MNLNEIIKGRVIDLLDFSDNIVEEIEKSKITITELTNDIIKKDKGGSDPITEINKQRSLMSYAFLLNDDLRRVIVKLSENYSLAKIENIDLGLEKTDIDRLELLVNLESTYFVNTPNGVKPKDKELYDKILSRVETNKQFTAKAYLEELRKAPIYGQTTEE